jgi:exonuclease SbcC
VRIESVTAVAFGPYSGDVLELSPGMNVVYGPNESGKSSWHAAIYAAMCGLKKTRGQPTREDRAFAARHRPWRGTSWKVTAVLALDDGRAIEIEQALGSGGTSTARDRATKKALTGDIVRAGAVDASTLLGLSRETAIATVFIRQADILRVLSDAGALQQYLEQAAATSSVDTTAQEALRRIAEYKKERVGLLRAGSRGPIATATQRLQQAREALDLAEERFESYQELLAERHAADAVVHDAERRLAELIEHEQERLRRERWVEIRAAERRLEQARSLASASGTSVDTIDKSLIASVNEAITTFKARPAELSPLEGPTAAELEAQLLALPDMPEGDLEPASEVSSLLERWRADEQRLAAHDENEPSAANVPNLPGPPSEIRRLADEIELPIPTVDGGLAEEVEARRVSPPPVAMSAPEVAATQPVSAPRSMAPTVMAGVLGVVGIVLVMVGQPIVGALVLVVAAAAGVAASRSKNRRTASPRGFAAPVPTAVAAPVDEELPRLEARLALQQEAQLQAQGRRDRAAARLAELGLHADPDSLRTVAAEAEAASSVETRHREWRRRRDELASNQMTTATALAAALATRGVAVAGDAEVADASARYAQECRARAEVARQAERRADVEAQLASTKAAEASREKGLAARTDAERQLRAAAEGAGCRAATVDELVEVLQAWVAKQGELDEARELHDKTIARLEQVLDGLTLDELEVEIGRLIEDAGEPPADETPMKDRSGELATAQAQAQQRRDRLSELVGQVDGAEKHLVDVAAAIEAEARAASEVARLTSLADDLDVAAEILGAAQEKVHADIAPVLNETIRPWVPRITRGRYDDIRVNPATLEIEAHEAWGQFRAATVLSHGTTEQLFLLLRLALAQRLTTTGESAPVILDDITVQSDADRTVAALDLLHELSGEHQVVLFSQEDEVRRWAEENLHVDRDRYIALVAR